MGRAFQLGTIAGIRVQVHWTFSLLLAWVVVTALMAGKGLIGAFASTAFILVLFGCVVLHEFGHALAARHFGIPTRDITLLPIGGVARLERMPRKPWQEFVVAVAGPAVNVLIAAVLLLLLAPSQGISQLLSIPSGNEPFLQRVLFVNLVLVAFNLLPAFPMDGGRVLRSFLASFMDYVAATRVAATVGQACAIGFGFLGLVNPMLLLLAAFVFFGATAELRQVEMLERLRGWRVRDAMTRDFRFVPAKAPIAACAIGLLNSPQHDFPVTDDGEYFGMLRRSDLLRAIRQGQAQTIGDIADTAIPALDEVDPLSRAIEKSSGGHQPIIPVTRDSVVTGLVDIRRVFDVVAARSQLRSPPMMSASLIPQRASSAFR